ncbi:MAG: cation-translocating P-type ATPase, partial [Turicibacter sp.]
MNYQKEVKEVLSELQSSVTGLTSAQGNERLNRDGQNSLKGKKKISTWKLFLETFMDPLVIILVLAALIQIVVGEVVESIIIVLVVCLNAILSVTQTKKAEGSLESLKKLSTPHAKVIRENKKLSITSADLVVGDIVLLEAGDYVPADARVMESQSLKVVEGMLTGESEPVLKHADPIIDEVVLGDRKNMVFSGSMVVYGRASVVVTETGMNSQIGKVAELLEDAEQKQTPLQLKLEDFSKKLGVIILILASVIFILQVTRGYFTQPGHIQQIIIDSFMFSVAIAVAAIPEALSSIVTIVLAVGTNTLAKKQAIVRKLPAVETLGSTSIICTDKTGTLTQNKMTVVDVFMLGTDPQELDFERINFSYHAKTLSMVSTLCNDSLINDEGVEIGDPTEVALINYSSKNQVSYANIRERYNRIGEIPFDS